MDLNEPSRESLQILENVTFKTPMLVDRHKLHPYTVHESGYMSASSPDMNSTSGSLPSSIQIARRLSNDSQLSVSPEFSFGAHMLRSIEASPDSGFDSESMCGSLSSGKDSVSLDLDVDMSIPLVSGMKRPAAPDVPSSAHSCRLAVNFNEIGPQLWQSTPVHEDSKPSRVTFAESYVFQQSPTKRRRPSAKKASRDLFQSRRKGAFSSLSEDYPSTSSAELPSFAGHETVDFLFYLGKQSSHQPALESILRHLSPADLCRASLVSRSWKSIIEGTPTVARKKQDYIESCIEVKENLTQVFQLCFVSFFYLIQYWFIACYCPGALSVCSLLQSVKKTGITLPFRGQLIEVQNYSHPEEIATPEPRSPPVSPSKVRFNLFLKVS